MSQYEGQVIAGRYRIKQRIGSGGMAQVFLAEDDVLHREVAVKILHTQYANDPEFVERFRREAQSAAGLNHPNIVAVFDRGTHEDTFYIVMELLKGQNLKELIMQEAPLPPERVAEIGVQICSALQFAHENGVIHRDIKPQNIILSNGHIKVTDFGIARATSDSQVTRTGTILGTAHYLSPEQAQGGKVLEQSDLYSLGVILYEMTTGSLPFTGESPIAIALKHVNEEPISPRKLVGSIPKPLDAIIMKSLSKDIDRRYPSSEEMKKDLELFARGLPPLALHDMELYRTQRRPATRSVASNDRQREMTAMPQRGNRVQAKKRRGIPAAFWYIAIAILVAAAVASAFMMSRKAAAPESVMVPSMVGRQADTAVRILQEAGFKPVIKGQEFSDNYPQDAVTRQDPAGGENLEPTDDKKVYLWVSRGAEKLTVPDLAGLTEAEAGGQLAGLGLKVGAVGKQHSDRYGQGEVMSQKPVAGTEVTKGASVDITLSQGADKVSVPSVVGMTDGRAASSLSGRGFGVRRMYETSGRAEKGIVIRQEPSSGSMVRPGSDITIVISSGVAKVSVPGIIGFTEEAATRQIKGVGLRVSITYRQTDEAPAGAVISQQPAGGAQVFADTTVSIVVAQELQPGTTSRAYGL